VSTHQFLVEDCFQQDLVDLPARDLVLFAELEGLGKQVPDQLHELVDAVVVDQIPLLVQVRQHGLQEEECVFAGQLQQQFRDAGAQVVTMLASSALSRAGVLRWPCSRWSTSSMVAGTAL